MIVVDLIAFSKINAFAEQAYLVPVLRGLCGLLLVEGELLVQAVCSNLLLPVAVVRLTLGISVAPCVLFEVVPLCCGGFQLQEGKHLICES